MSTGATDRSTAQLLGEYIDLINRGRLVEARQLHDDYRWNEEFRTLVLVSLSLRAAININALPLKNPKLLDSLPEPWQENVLYALAAEGQERKTQLQAILSRPDCPPEVQQALEQETTDFATAALVAALLILAAVAGVVSALAYRHLL